MRIALLQSGGTPGDVDANLGAVERAAGDAARAGARLLICPETFLTGYHIGAEALARLAQPADGPAVSALSRIAAGAGIAIVCGYPERAGDAVYNAAVLVERDGSTLATYRKAHLFGAIDRDAFRAGGEPALATLDGVRVGLLVCYDIEFPEAARALAVAGAELIAVPTSLMVGAEHVAELLVPARAAENQVFVAYANRVGREGELVYVGRSCVAGPDGARTVAGPGETLLLADLDLGAIARSRSAQSYLDDRRPSLYAE
jgi:predicted amidohydrolase